LRFIAPPANAIAVSAAAWLPARRADRRHPQRRRRGLGRDIGLGHFAINAAANDLGQAVDLGGVGGQQVVERDDADELRLIVGDQQAAHAAGLHRGDRIAQVVEFVDAHQALAGQRADGDAGSVQALGQRTDHQVTVGDDAVDTRPLGRRRGDHQRADMALAHQRGGLGERVRALDGDEAALADRADVHGAVPFRCCID
jgi:hypothetical protein